MKIASRWKLTHDPDGAGTVLLNYGDYLDAELDIGLERTVEVRPLAAAAAPFIRPAGNNVYVFEFTCYNVASSDSNARQAMMNTLMSTDDLGKKPLRLRIANEEGEEAPHYYQWGAAAVRGCSVVRDLDSSRPRWGRKYTIVATTLTRNNL